MPASQASQMGVNLERAAVLVFDPDTLSMAITAQVLAGFGAKNLVRCDLEKTAETKLASQAFDLVVFDASRPENADCKLIAALRRDANARSRFAPVLVVTAYTQFARINRARLAGASFVVAKPITPSVMMERIQWLSRDPRPYVECASYAGPDRRFKFDGPPAGSDGRRIDDLKGELGAAEAPNLSQADIDALMQPRKIAL